MLGTFNKKQELSETWTQLDSMSQLEEIDSRSEEIPCVIFKHSTRCSISSAVKHRLERSDEQLSNTVKIYYLDLLAHRDVSNAIAGRYDVIHESPQVLVIRNKKCLKHASHSAVTARAILQALAEN